MAQYANGVTWQFDPTKLLSESPSYGTAIAEVVNISSTGETVDLLDSTVHGDTHRTRVAGLKDGGTADITIRFETNDATHKAVRDARGVLCAHKFTFPKMVSTNTVPFSAARNGIIQSFSIAAAFDSLMEMTVSIQFSGATTYVEEAA